MKNFKKIISVVLCTAFVAGMLGGCGKKVDKDNYVAKTREEASEQSQAEASENSTDAKPTVDWTTMEFSLNDTSLTFNRLPYSTMKELGWSFDPAIYGMENISAESGSFYQKSIYLSHADYDEATVLVGLTNFEEEPCGLDKISLWTIEFNAKDKAKFPDVTLTGGITWGNDEATVKAAYGEPLTTERNDEEGFTVLKYSDNAGKAIFLTVYDETGVGIITLESFV